MQRISGYFIRLLIITCSLSAGAQDSIKVHLNIRAGIDIYGPVVYYGNRNNLTAEGFVALERNAKKSFILEAGYQNFKYSQSLPYNYSWLSNGVFFRSGIDFNMIKPFEAAGKYYAGIGLRYGLSIYRSEVPSFQHDNYWGTGTGFIPSSMHVAHFVEVDPGIRTEILKDISIGWNLRLRLMIYSGAKKDLKPVSVPGYGNGVSSFSPGINYYLIINIPYKSVYVKPEVEKAPEKETESVKQQ
jgi:Domain of unknown function (DUF6048)